MFITLSVAVTGILFLLIPHFSLPLGYVKGGTGALLLSDCSIWYHPEVYLGPVIIIVSIASLKNKKYLYLLTFLGILGVIHSFLIRPVSFYLQNESPIIILSQTISIRSHKHIFLAVLILSLLTITLSIVSGIHKYSKKTKITLHYLSMSTIRRKKFRSSALVVSLTLIIGSFFSDILLMKRIEKTLELGAGRLGADLMVIPKGEEKAAQTILLSGGPTLFYLKSEILTTLNTYPEIEKISPQLYVQPLSYKVCCIIDSILIIAYDSATDFTVSPWIQYSLKDNQKPFDIVVGRLVKFYPGQTIDLFGRSLNVVASLEPTGLGYFDNSAFIPLKGARDLLRELRTREKTKAIATRQEILDESFSHFLPTDKDKRISIHDIDPDGVSALFIKAKGNVSIKALTEKIMKDFNNISVVNVKEYTYTVKRRLSSILRTLFMPILIIMIMGTFMLGFIFAMSIHERQREIGILRSLGAQKRDIANIIFYEAAILSGIGGIFGILLGSGLILVFKNKIMSVLNLIYIWPSPQAIFTAVILTGVISLFIGILAALFPALRAANAEPYTAIRSGE